MNIIGILIVIFIIVCLTVFMVKHMSKQIDRDYEYYLGIKRLGKMDKHFKCSKLPTIKITINGTRYPFILDSGANTNVVDKSIVEALGLDKEAVKYNLEGTSGTVQGTQYKTSMEFSYNNQVFQEEFNTLDMKNIRDQLSSIGIEAYGMLGAAFFEKHRWSLDFNKMVVWQRIKK